ncbi:MAG: ATP-dependent DNA ligase [Polyangiaceae bacterium]|nr:ATP-dependent DNA ligase [Polyangiaceae bacterium]
MDLVVPPPIAPMLSKRAESLPEGPGWLFEPKWDGFRTLVFRDGDEILLQSRDQKPMNRYFPEIIPHLLEQLPKKCVLDGEIVIAREGALDFEALQLRIHPAASRVKMLGEQMPSSMVFWDVLALGDEDLKSVPFGDRRKRLEQILVGVKPPIHITPATPDRAVAHDWFMRFEGAGLDGVMAKPISGAYEPDKRSMFKIKHERTCDCVVAGFRWHKNGKGTLVGSLLLGLYDKNNSLQFIGVTASFTEKKRRELAAFLEPYREGALESHPWKDWAEWEGTHTGEGRRPGATSRWNRDKDLSWEALRTELVVEVAYDHMQGTRFRHTAQFRRWRTDKPPADCRFDQLEVTPPFELSQIFAQG